ncbi:MAG TPA: DUF1214 domain-containing protein [Acidimicrobiales bacterium]|nr:DUF1214 domain-containing protein [Acidimicrobiales bacterium]
MGGVVEGRWSESAALESFQLVLQMLGDTTAMVRSEAETELELVEGLRVIARVAALSSEVSLDVDPECPWFFNMNTEARLIGGPNPDGEYHLATIDGRHRYLVSGDRNSVTYLGFQVLAGTGLTPRRMAAHVSDRDLAIDADGRFSFVLATDEPAADELDGATWVAVPPDASAIVVRQYIVDRASERQARMAIESLDPPGRPSPPTDDLVAGQLTAMAWTIAKLTTLHRTVRPELLEQPNRLVTAEATELGDDTTTPDNLYMMGTFRLAEGESLVLHIEPPETRYWSVTIENIWHECIDTRRRPTSFTNAGAIRQGDGTVRVVISATEPEEGSGAVNWLDTGGRHRGFVTLRWLDNPSPPGVRTSLIAPPDGRVAGHR